MATAARRGLSFGLYVDIAGTLTLVAGATNVSLERTKNIIDTTHAGSGGWTDGIAGDKSWSVDLDTVALVDDATGDLAASQAALEAAYESDEPITVAIRRYGQDGTLGKEGRTGLAHIESLSENGPQDGRFDFSVSLTGVGPLEAETT